MQRFRLIFIYILVIAVAVALGFWLFKSSEKQEANMPGHELEYQGQGHMPSCTPGDPPYNSNPPTSGCHDPAPADWGTYDAALTDQKYIHNLEHGGIWISYKPDRVDAETVLKLKDFANRYKLIIVAHREANDAPISLAAWMHLLNLDSFDERAILEFIEAYHNKGPEVVM